MIGKPKLAPAVICILTFCIVTVVVVDAVIPFGFLFVQVLKGSDLPITVQILLLIPIVGLLVASFIIHTPTRGILTALCAFGLVIVWVLGLILFVVYPIARTSHPTAAKIFPAITSIPFVVAIIGTMWHSIRNIFAGNAPQQIVGRERRERVS
jgi:hypothetical protein